MLDVFSQSLAAAALAVLVYMIGSYLVALARRNLNVADIAWGPAFLVAALAALWSQSVISDRQLIVLGLVAIWSIRLAVHVFIRNWERGEDWRHAHRRARWTAPAFFHAFWEIFMAQGFLVLTISLPVIYVLAFRGPALGTLDWVGLGVWGVGFLIEIGADHQLARFMSNPALRGQRLSSGFWRYHAHPNYIGEALLWWGIWLMALSIPGAWWTVLGPLTITLILLKSHRHYVERKIQSTAVHIA